MIVAKVEFNDVIATTVWAMPITAGMVGAQIEITYTGSMWPGLENKIVVFSGAVTRDIRTTDTVVVIPAECVSIPNVILKVGICGISADNTVLIPTLCAGIGRVMRGADPSGDPSTDQGLPFWAQVLADVGDLDQLDTDDKSSLVAAVNEAMRRGGGDVDEEAVRQIVADYLAENPPDPGESGGGASLNAAVVDGVLCLMQSGSTHSAEIVDDVLVLK